MANEQQEPLAPDQGLDVSQGGATTSDGAPQGSDQGVSVSSPQQPANLDEAFRMLRQSDGGGAESQVSEPEESVADGNGNGDNATSGGSPATQPGDAGNNGSVNGTQGQGAAGYTASTSNQQPPVTVNSIRTVLQDQAIRMTQAEFEKQGAKPISINDLYQRDERTGRVTFTNPDDPDRPFASRADAQDFVNAWNQQIDDEKRAYAREVYKQLQDQQADVIKLIEFSDTYRQMSPQVQRTFEALLQPYQTTNAQGQIVFPGADFRRLHQQALNLVQLDAARGQQASQPQQPPAQNQHHTPAIDIKSGSSSSKKDQAPPTTLAEAMRRVSEEKRRMREKKGNK